LIEQEAKKNYPSPAIVNAVKEYGTDSLSLGSTVQELKRKEVANIKHKVRGAMETNLIGSDNIGTDIFEAKSHLENQGYQVNHFHVSSHSSQGLVFVRSAFNFRTKKVSAYGVDNEIVEEIQKFPYPFQKLLIKEACAVMKRIESGKNAPVLTSLDCDCLFINKYLLPCKHIFHEHMYGSTKLLTDEHFGVWFEIYERREQITILVPQTDEQRRTDS